MAFFKILDIKNSEMHKRAASDIDLRKPPFYFAEQNTGLTQPYIGLHAILIPILIITTIVIIIINIIII